MLQNGTITCRKVVGGFEAWLDEGKSPIKYVGKTKEEAVGKLFLNLMRQISTTFTWDEDDLKTKAYIEGRPYREAPGPLAIDTSKLPKAASPEQAARLKITSLKVPLRLTKAMIYAYPRSSDALGAAPGAGPSDTLGDVCKYTEQQLVTNGSDHMHPFGPKTLELLYTLLDHYGFKLAE